MQNNTTILCIDDEEQICFALEALFRLQKWNVVTARSVEKGLIAFREFQPDIVLIDYHMPGINGVEGVKMLRQLSPTVPSGVSVSIITYLRSGCNRLLGIPL